MGKPYKRKPGEQYRPNTVCCLFCGRIFLGQFHLSLHLQEKAKPLWKRALYRRFVLAKLATRETGLPLPYTDLTRKDVKRL